MQKQNFEKQVQDKMEELSFVPSEPVWQKVEEQIRKKKERRRLIIWILFPFLLLAGGLFWGLSEQKKNESISSNKQNETLNIPAEKNIDPIISDEETDTPNNKPIIQTPIEDNKEVVVKAPVSNNHKLIASKSNNNNQAPKKRNTKKDQLATQVDETAIAQHKKQITTNDDKTTADIKEPKKETSPVTATNDSTSDETKKAETIKTDTPVKVEEQKTNVPDPVETVVINKKQSKNKSLQWGIIAKVGASGVTEGLLNLFDVQMEDARVPFSFANTNAGGVAPVLSPSSSVRGLSFSAGISVRKALGSRSFLLSGINYNYYSTNSYVGQEVNSDTTVTSPALTSVRTSAYYRNNSRLNKYHTNYHFIELPLSFEYQLFRKLPLNVNAGVSVMQMISNNALFYNSQANIYYKNDDYLKKTQLHLSAGVTYELWKKNKKSLLIGPQFQYGQTPLKVSSDQRLFFLGVGSKFFF